jgi:hypothetical protein
MMIEDSVRLAQYLQKLYPEITAAAVTRVDQGVWVVKQECAGPSCKFWTARHDPMVHKMVLVETSSNGFFRIWDVLPVTTGQCRLCGESTHLTREPERITFHYPTALKFSQSSGLMQTVKNAAEDCRYDPTGV